MVQICAPYMISLYHIYHCTPEYNVTISFLKSIFYSLWLFKIHMDPSCLMDWLSICPMFKIVSSLMFLMSVCIYGFVADFSYCILPTSSPPPLPFSYIPDTVWSTRYYWETHSHKRYIIYKNNNLQWEWVKTIFIEEPRNV